MSPDIKTNTKQTTKTMTDFAQALSNLKSISKFNMNPDELIFDGTGFSIRNDKSMGQWKIGESTRIGDELDFLLLEVSHTHGRLGQSTCNWTVIYFVPVGNKKCPERTVCVTHLNGRSADNFRAKQIDLISKGINPQQVLWKSSFAAHNGASGNYFSLIFDTVDIDAKDTVVTDAFIKMIGFLGKGFELNPCGDVQPVQHTSVGLLADGSNTDPHATAMTLF